MQPGSVLVLPRGVNGMHDTWVDRQSSPYIQPLHPHWQGNAAQACRAGEKRRRENLAGGSGQDRTPS